VAVLLLFNIHDEEKRTAIRLLSLRLGYSVLDVLPEQQSMKISELLSGAKPVGQNLIPFTDEMMVMSGFSSQDMHALLDGMRNNGCPVRLKCIVTETNKSWTATRLHKELIAEDQAMRKRTSKR
jgi:hypothetical protein